jgi:hypothetical protein
VTESFWNWNKGLDKAKCSRQKQIKSK